MIFFSCEDPLILPWINRHYGNAEFSFETWNIDLDSLFPGEVHHRKRNHHRDLQVNDLGGE